MLVPTVAAAQAQAPATTPAAATVAPATPEKVLARRNIEDLSKAELAAFEHAMAMLKIKSGMSPVETKTISQLAKTGQEGRWLEAIATLTKEKEISPYNQMGFIWQAWVHNCNSVWVPPGRVPQPGIPARCGGPKPREDYVREHPGMCEHRKDLFLPWHRAQFYYFEKALQAADPEGRFGPSTAEVTVPYWDFTKEPSGIRYPKRFEDEDSPLFHKDRERGKLDPRPTYTSPQLLEKILSNPDWLQFGGFPVGGKSTQGDFEAEIHNFMHYYYVGGSMRDPRKAANDPVFFVFHSFLDYIYEEWISRHTSKGITSTQVFLRSYQDPRLPDPPGYVQGDVRSHMGRVNLYFDTKSLGYVYDPGRRPPFQPRTALASTVAESDNASFAFGRSPVSPYNRAVDDRATLRPGQPDIVLQAAATPPASFAPDEKAYVAVVRKSAAADASFVADVYLHPSDVEADLSNSEFRLRYLVTRTSYWGAEERAAAQDTASHHHHGSADGDDAGGAKNPVAIGANITAEMRDLVGSGQATGRWTVTVVISAQGGKPMSFADPELTIFK